MNTEYKKVKKIKNKTKALIQVRNDAGGNTLHLQVYGEEMEHHNRDYGYADKFTVPEIVTDSVRQWGGTLYPSLATENPIYFRDIATVHAFSDGVQLHIKVGSPFWNSPNGFIVDLPAHRFATMVAFLEANDLLITHEGTRFISSSNDPIHGVEEE